MLSRVTLTALALTGALATPETHHERHMARAVATDADGLALQPLTARWEPAIKARNTIDPFPIQGRSALAGLDVDDMSPRLHARDPAPDNSDGIKRLLTVVLGEGEQQAMQGATKETLKAKMKAKAREKVAEEKEDMKNSLRECTLEMQKAKLCCPAPNKDDNTDTPLKPSPNPACNKRQGKPRYRGQNQPQAGYGAYNRQQSVSPSQVASAAR